MAENQINYAIDGQEFAQADINTILGPLGLMDDRVFAEILRLPSFDGTNTYKTIIPTGQQLPEGSAGSTPVNPGTVQSTGTANGSIIVNPFRAVVGSRTAVGTSTLQNYRDIRTSICVGVTSLANTILLANNSSGSPRWDLVYAIVQVDVPTGSFTRRTKNPNTGVLTTGALTTYLANIATVNVVTGTPGSNPAIPALPADSGNTYNVALAAVLVPTGFTLSSTVVQQGIRDLVGDKNLTNGGGQTVANLTPTLGVTAGPLMASGNNDRVGTYASNFPWTTTPASARSPLFLPPSMVGGVQMLVAVDTSGASPSHANGSIVDDTIDWRKRIFHISASGSAFTHWGMDPTIGTSQGAPGLFGGVTGAIMTTLTYHAQSLSADGTIVASASSIFSASISTYPSMASGSSVGLYVLASDGILRWFSNATASGLKWFFWVTVTQQFPNP